MIKVLIIGSLFFITGCGLKKPTALQIGKDTYTMSGNFRDILYESAIDTCIKRNLVMKPIEEKRLEKYILDFKCIDANSDEYKDGSTYKTSADIVIDSKIEVK